MRLWISLTLGVVTALAVMAAPSIGAPNENFNLTFSLVGQDNSGALCSRRDGSTKTAVPMLGVSSVVFHSELCVNEVDPVTFIGYMTLDVTAPNGDEFVLGSGPTDDVNVDLHGQWHVISGTGRFASCTGTGSYSINHGDSSRLTFTLMGRLQPH
jgi:hypothetical protein